ncbi:hypothetical protein [Novosphingobium mathurense]|uniref:hypothetical protein n=1 Tax=Novosphingobium mathurense TaxID=428990 RepID=UPI00159043DA|nr:hypothetical protein [Novosphingobium mathurense]
MRDSENIEFLSSTIGRGIEPIAGDLSSSLRWRQYECESHSAFNWLDKDARIGDPTLHG